MTANLAGLNNLFAARLSAAIAAAETATGARADFVSGRRTAAQGVSIWNRATDGGRHGPSFPAARPGRSLHEQGMAVDMAAGPVRDWVQKHAKEYGLEPANAKRGFGWDAPHIQLARGVPKTSYDSTPSMWAGDGQKLPPGSIPNAGQPPTSATLRKGMTGPNVTQLQQQLADAGLYKGKIDGSFGPQTAAAVRAAETTYGLNRDRGVAGPQVQAALAGGPTRDITSTFGMMPPGGPAGPDVNPTDIAFGRAQAQMPWDVSPVAAQSFQPGNPMNQGPFNKDVPMAPMSDPRMGGGAPVADEMAGSGGLTSGRPPSQMSQAPFDLSGGSLTAGGGAPGASATMAMIAPPAPPAGSGYPYPTGTGRSYGTDDRGISELMLGRAMTSPDSFATNAWPETRSGAVASGPSYDTIYSLNSRIDPNMGSGQDASADAIHAALPGAVERAAAAKAASMSYPSMVAGRPDYPAPNSPSNSTGINGVLAGISGIPGAIFGPGGPIWNASEAVNGWLGGGSEPAAAKPQPAAPDFSPAVPAPSSYGVPSDLVPYSQSGLQSSLSGYGASDVMRGNAGADQFGPAGGNPALSSPGDISGVTFMPPSWSPQMDTAPAFFPSPPSLHVQSSGSPTDRLTAFAHDLSSGAGLSAPSQSGGSFGSPGGRAPWAGPSPAQTTNWINSYLGSSGVTPGSYVGATPSGYNAPNFNPISGGATYAYQPNGNGGGTYVDSHGNVHSY